MELFMIFLLQAPAKYRDTPVFRLSVLAIPIIIGMASIENRRLYWSFGFHDKTP